MACIHRKSFTKVGPTNGTRIKGKSAKWYITYKDADGIRRCVPGFKDKTATAQYANKLERDAELGRSGVRDHFAIHRKRPLAEHLADFEAHLTARKISAEQIKLLKTRCQKIVAGCGFAFIADVSPSAVDGFLAQLRAGGTSTQTSNHYLRAIKQFAHWLVKDRRAADNPLAHLSMLNVKLDRRHVRRALTDAELGALIGAAERGPTVRKTAGKDRAMLYTVAAFTGLRASELASLTPESFELTAEPPTVRLGAMASKHRREDALPLHSQLVSKLGIWLADKAPQSPVWPGNWADGKEAGVMLKVDLKAAGVPYVDSSGEVADFHSLRHTFISRLARHGVSLKTAQILARHSTVELTANCYTHLGVCDVAAAMESLPPIFSASMVETDAEALRATGTDGPTPTIKFANQLANGNRKWPQSWPGSSAVGTSCRTRSKRGSLPWSIPPWLPCPVGRGGGGVKSLGGKAVDRSPSRAHIFAKFANGVHQESDDRRNA
jgi:integrase